MTEFPHPGPLTGVRVIDLGHSWAAPFASMVLADMGADVIKIETGTRIDILRWSGAFVDGLTHHERSGYHIACNRGKRSVTLNLKTADGVQVLLDLIAGADVLLENFSPRVLPSLGLDRATLLAANPTLVVMSMSGYGSTGSERNNLSYGDHLMHASGFASLLGEEGDEHTKIGTYYGDPVAGLFAALRITSSLVATRSEGVHHEMAQLDGLVSMIPVDIMRSSRGDVLHRSADKSASTSPRGFYRCAGVDRWVSLEVRSDAEWTELRNRLRIDGIAVPDFDTLGERKALEKDLDEAVSSWVATRSAWDVTHVLQSLRIPAFPLFSADDMLKDVHLRAREFFVWTNRAISGPSVLPGVTIRVANGGSRVRGPAPLLGEHNEEILIGELGLTRESYDRLVESGAVA